MNKLITTRPAETITAACAAAILIGWIVGIEDADKLLALAVLLGGVPAGITWLVELVRGRRSVL